MKKLILIPLLLGLGCSTVPLQAVTGISAGAGNWTTAATWKTAEAGAGALQITRSASTNTTASYVYGSAFTCTNLDVIEGMILHLNRLGVVGTVTVALSDDNGVTDTRNLVVNAADISAGQTEHYFQFAATLTCDGGADYKVGVKHSGGGSGAAVYRDATAGNWFHVLQTSTAFGAAPAAADNLHVVGFTVTMDQTAATDHGTLDIGQTGVLSYGVAAATNYYLKCSGNVNVWTDGTLSIGTAGVRMPANSTATLDLDSAAVAQFGVVVRGTFNAYGDNSVAATATLLAADVAVNGTALTSTAATGWLNNWEIVLPSTSSTIAQFEKGALNGDAVGVAITVDGFAGAGGGVAFAHSGTLPYRGEILRLTHNVKIHGASVANTGYVSAITGSTVAWSYAEFYWLGKSASAVDGGISLPTGVTGDVQRCSFHDFNAWSVVLTQIGTFDNNNIYLNSGVTNNPGVNPTLSAAQSWQNNYIVGTHAHNPQAMAGTYSGNTVASVANITSGGAWLGATLANNTIHSSIPITFNSNHLNDTTLTGWTFWRCNSGAVNVAALFSTQSRVLLDSFTVYGRFTFNVSQNLRDITIRGGTFNSDASFAAANGLLVSAGTFNDVLVENTTFGATTGYTTSDLSVSSATMADHFVCQNCNLASATPVSAITGVADVPPFTHLHFARWAQTNGSHRTYYRNGLSQTDAVIVNTNPVSWRMTPTGATATWKLTSNVFPLKVANGATGTFTVKVRKSQVADAGGADYGGAQPRLMLKANYACGIAAAVLDTMTVAVGNWETLTGASGAVTDDCVLEAYVDCDGSAGWVNVADWSPVTADYYLDGLPKVGLGSAGGGGTRSYPSGP